MPSSGLCRPWFVLLVAAGCTSNNSSSTTTDAETLVGVAPENFLLEATCNGAGSAGASGEAIDGGEVDGGTSTTTVNVQSYIATLREKVAVDYDAGVWSPMVIRNSPLASCSQTIVFDDVLSGRYYDIVVALYAQSPSQLTTADGGIVTDRQGNYVAPIERRLCGAWRKPGSTDPEPGVASSYTTVKLQSCVTQ